MNDALHSSLDAFAARFHARASLLEREERTRGLPPRARNEEREAIAKLRDEAEAEDEECVRAFLEARASIDMKRALSRLSDHPLDDSPHLGDEALDAFVERLLGTHGRFDGGASPGLDMIHYDPSPASAALALAARGWFDEGEVFVDLGSGTGRVVVLAQLLGKAHAVGVEIDEPLVDEHRRAASELSLPFDVRVGDARLVPLEDGTRFFFFAPFLGPVLEAVLARLEAIAKTRTIHVGSWGPSTAELARAKFLVPTAETTYSPFDLATFRAGPGLFARGSVASTLSR